MSPRTANAFFDTMTVMSVLANAKDGMTKGQIQKELKYVTMGQVGRMIDTLMACKFIWAEKKPHGATGKFVYRMTEGAAIFCASIAREYTERY